MTNTNSEGRVFKYLIRHETMFDAYGSPLAYI